MPGVNAFSLQSLMSEHTPAGNEFTLKQRGVLSAALILQERQLPASCSTSCKSTLHVYGTRGALLEYWENDETQNDEASDRVTNDNYSPIAQEH